MLICDAAYSSRCKVLFVDFAISIAATKIVKRGSRMQKRSYLALFHDLPALFAICN